EAFGAPEEAVVKTADEAALQRREDFEGGEDVDAGAEGGGAEEAAIGQGDDGGGQIAPLGAEEFPDGVRQQRMRRAVEDHAAGSESGSMEKCVWTARQPPFSPSRVRVQRPRRSNDSPSRPSPRELQGRAMQS